MDHLAKALAELRLFLVENELRALQICLTILVFGVILFVLAPIFTIWSLNVLGLKIPTNFTTWVSICWLTFVIRFRLPRRG